jgi:hypothetical protein
VDAAQPQQQSSAIALILATHHPLRPGRGKVPLPLRKLLPDPEHEDGWAMLTHDVSQLSPAQRRARAWRLRVAIAMCEPDDVCDWALEHIAVLEAA